MSPAKVTVDRVMARAVPPVAAYPDIACRGENPEIFFPSKGIRATRAREICGRCTHRAECLEWALRTRQSFGIWAGTSPEERIEMLTLLDGGWTREEGA